MIRLLGTCIMLGSLVCALPLCFADTTEDLRNVFTYMPPPQYPPEASEQRSNGWRRIEGTTLCRVSLDAKGAVTAVRIIKSSGNKALDTAASAAFWSWRARAGRSGRFFDIPVKFLADQPSPQLPGNLGNLGHNPNR